MSAIFKGIQEKQIHWSRNTEADFEICVLWHLYTSLDQSFHLYIVSPYTQWVACFKA